ncbi:MAG: hypothetical protein ACFB5Z_07305 [Elainellaceae cyanobacterium]
MLTNTKEVIAMSHTYEVFVDIRECEGVACASSRRTSARYEIAAESTQSADYAARSHAGHDFPDAAELDVRITRILH